MKTKKLSVAEQKKLLPDDKIREAFMRREDIKSLSEAERESRWQEHLVALDKSRQFLSKAKYLGKVT